MSAERPRWLVPAFGAALLLALLFSGDALWRVSRLGTADAPVREWMTPGLVAATYGTPPAALAAVLGDAEPGTTLAEIAAARGVDPAALVAAVAAVVAR